MIRKALLATLLAASAAIATPALAQNGPPPSPYTPRVDKPTCTAEQLKAKGIDDFQLTYALDTLRRTAPNAMARRN